MQGKLTTLKNMIWAVCIVICLVSLLVGCIASSIPKYEGERQDGILYLNGSSGKDSVSEDSAGAEELPSDAPAADYGSSGVLNVLPEASDGGQAYIDSLTFLCDSTFMGLKDYALLSGGYNTTQVWRTEAGNLPATDLADPNIVNPSDGVVMPVSMAAGLNKPPILVICLSIDSLAEANKNDFIADYESLIGSIRSQSPGTTIFCCSSSSVTTSYDSLDGTTFEMVTELNEWIKQVCTDTGAYFADTASAVCDPAGMLMNNYASINGQTLNSSGLTKILEYLRTHRL